MDNSVAELGLDKSGAETELGAVLEYLAKIEGDCIAKAETYEEFNLYWVLQLASVQVWHGRIGFDRHQPRQVQRLQSTFWSRKVEPFVCVSVRRS